MVVRWAAFKRRLKGKREIRAIAQGLRFLAILRRISEEQKDGRLAHVANVLQYSLAVQLDSCVLMTDVITERDRWRQNVYARHLGVLLIEFLDDIHGVLGKQFDHELQALFGKHPEVLKLCRSLQKGLASIGQQYRTELREIRNIAAAHRDHDGHLQFELMTNVNVVRVVLVVGEAVYLWQHLVLRLCHAILRKRFPAQWKEANTELLLRPNLGLEPSRRLSVR